MEGAEEAIDECHCESRGEDSEKYASGVVDRQIGPVFIGRAVGCGR